MLDILNKKLCGFFTFQMRKQWCAHTIILIIKNNYSPNIPYYFHCSYEIFLTNLSSFPDSILPAKVTQVQVILPWVKRKHKIILLHTLFSVSIFYYLLVWRSIFSYFWKANLYEACSRQESVTIHIFQCVFWLPSVHSDRVAHLRYSQGSVKMFHCNVMVIGQKNSAFMGGLVRVLQLHPCELNSDLLLYSPDSSTLIFYFTLSTATEVNTKPQHEKCFQCEN